jgi:hypothetical protein
MLHIKVNMNSTVEDVLAFKTCCNLKMADQNLELLVTNKGNSPVEVQSYFDLEGDQETLRIKTLMPQPHQLIEPGQVKAFYCELDESRYKAARRLVMFDSDGVRYSVDIN